MYITHGVIRFGMLSLRSGTTWRASTTTQSNIVKTHHIMRVCVNDIS